MFLVADGVFNLHLHSLETTLTVPAKGPTLVERNRASTSQLGSLHHPRMRNLTTVYANHLYAILYLPIGSIAIKVPSSARLNPLSL